MRLNPVFAELGDYPIARIQMRARDRRDAGLPVVDFSIGDPREPTPTFIAEALRDSVPEVSQYPTAAGLLELRSAIAGYVRRRFDVAVDAETQVIPTSGAKEAIFNTPFAFIHREAGDGVVYPTPGYPVYERGSLFAGARVFPIELSGDFDGMGHHQQRHVLIPAGLSDQLDNLVLVGRVDVRRWFIGQK